jgi:predicted DNA-binding transcriptional regulator YafY
VSDGERWHARCWCYEHKEWRDFVLARVAAIHDAEPAGPLPRDSEWEDAYRLVLKPAQGLSKGQRATVIREYAMKAGRLVVTIPRAMRLYAIRKWGLDRSTTRLEIIEETAADDIDDHDSEADVRGCY